MTLGSWKITALFFVLVSALGWVGFALWAILFIMKSAFSNNSDDKTKPHKEPTKDNNNIDVAIKKTVSSKITPVSEDITDSENLQQNIVIAVSSTESRAGGVIIMHNVHTLLFYSIDWSNFQNEADKLEMISALLAMKIFDWYTSEHCKWLKASCAGNKLILKTNGKSFLNPDVATTNGRSRQKMSLLGQAVQANPNMSIEYANEDTDGDMKIAFELSRSSSFKVTQSPVFQEYQEKYYQLINVSKYDSTHFLQTVKKLKGKNGTHKISTSGKSHK